MKKLTTTVLAVVLTSSFVMVDAQKTKSDTLKTKDLGEVVITGAMGIKKNMNAVTAATTVVGAKELTAASNPNVVQSLAGKVAGLQITTTDVGVDGTNRIVLRGSRSITSDNQALIVIDNVISSASILNQLPPDAIESMNVIKGLQGAALYGSQGVNGVIVVTTKKGTGNQRIQFNLTSSIDVSTIYKTPIVQKEYGQGIQDPTFSDVDYGGTNHTPHENTSWGPAYNNPKIGGQMTEVGLPQVGNTFLKALYSPIDNHFDRFFTHGITFQNGLSMNVGGSDSYAYLNLNRATTDFVVEGDKSLKNSFLFKAGKKMGKFRIDGDINYIYKESTETDHGLYDDMIQMPSNIDIRMFRNTGLEGNYTAYALNPYWTSQNERYNRKSTFLSALIALKYDINDHINLTYTGSLQNTMGDNDSHNNGFAFTRMYDNTGTGFDGTYFSDYGTGDITSWFRQSTSSRNNYYGDLLANFDYKLTDDLSFKLNAGLNSQDNNFRINSVGGDDLKIPGWYNYSNVRKPYLAYQLSNVNIRNRVLALLGNLDLAYKNFLYFNATFRKEWNSVLSVRPTNTVTAENPMGVQQVRSYAYYSAGLNFIVTNAFPSIKSDIFNYLKLSASYTKVGNAPIDPYAVDEIGIFPTGFPFGSNSAYIANKNPTAQTIQPEQVATTEFGAYFGFLKDRITLSGSYSKSNTSRLITNVTTSSATGLAQLQSNFGSMVNKSYEVELGLNPVKTRDFDINLKGYYAASNSVVTDLPAGVDEVNLLSYTTPAVGVFAIKGQKFPMIKGTKYLRDPNGHIIVDTNGNPQTTSTLEVLGKAAPDYTLGGNMSIRVKNFTLSGTADYRKGSSFVSLTKRTLIFTGADLSTVGYDRSKGYVIPNSVVNTGTAANPVYTANTVAVGGSPTYQGAMGYFTGAGRNIGEELVVDGTALKIREIALSYSVPRTVLENTFVSSITMGVYARNPFFKYAAGNHNYNDPETASTNGNAAGIALTTQYPNVRSFGFNFNATF